MSKIIHIDANHKSLVEKLNTLGFENHECYKLSKKEVADVLRLYEGIIIRSRFPLDAEFLQTGTNLKFICRIGAGLENIDLEFCSKNSITVLSTPTGNANAVAEHTLGLLLNLLNNIKKADSEVVRGIWHREANRGFELQGKTVGIIGYGIMGSSFAKKLAGFDCEVIFYDIEKKQSLLGHEQVAMQDLFQRADVVSFHVPQTPLTYRMANASFFNSFEKPIWLLNTARGTVVELSALVEALKSGRVLGAGLDVLEYESSSFETNFNFENNDDLKYLTTSKSVVLTPHIAGWSFESEVKMAEIAVAKIASLYAQ